MRELDAEELLSLSNKEQKLWVLKQDWYLDKHFKINLETWPPLAITVSFGQTNIDEALENQSTKEARQYTFEISGKTVLAVFYGTCSHIHFDAEFLGLFSDQETALAKIKTLGNIVFSEGNWH